MNEKLKEAIKALAERGCKVEVKTHCAFCGKEVVVPYEKAIYYVCDDCRDFFKTEMSEPVHETAKLFRRQKDGEQDA